ncbi:MAG: hypothetical protein FJ276_31455 [Planctomycetes bacterium]|nr:hypothetical protein [Planctomycetota bacterium]
MPSFHHQKTGKCLTVAGHPIRFSIYAAGAKPQHTRMLASNPWRCMELALNQNGKSDADCLAYLRQAHDFHVASEAAKATARPLLMYYSFLNLAKMLIKSKVPSLDLTHAIHGIAEPPGNSQSDRFTLTSQ